MKKHLNFQTVFLMVGLVIVSLASETRAAGFPPSSNAQRERAIAEVTRLGGTIQFGETPAGNPSAQKSIFKIDLHGTKVTDADLAFLENLTELRALDLRLTQITDAGVVHLRKLKNLQTLNLFRTQLGDAGLAQLNKMRQLETLLVGGTKVTDAGLINLRRFSKLKKLSLFQTQVSDAGIVHLKRLIKLETLLIGGSKITEQGSKELQKALPTLRFTETTL